MFLYLKALLFLLTGRLFLEELTRVDFQKELISNKQLAAAEGVTQEKARLDIRKGTISRGGILRTKLIKSFGWIFSACFIAIFLIILSSKVDACGLFTVKNLLGLFSIFSFAWATLGRLGWAGQSWRGDTIIERLDDLIFWILYWTGTFFGVLTFWK